MKIAVAELQGLVERALVSNGMTPSAAPTVAAALVAAERDGTRSHGLQRLPRYILGLKNGWTDGAADPVVEIAAPGLLKVDARNGFSQVGLAKASKPLREMVQKQGTAVMSMTNSHHIAALWPDAEPFAADGYLVLTMVNTRPLMLVWSAIKKAIGTNPMAFGCPRRGKPPIIWDQASSTMSQGDVLLAAAAKRELPAGAGVNSGGQPTTDPNAVLQGGALRPFGNVKGSSLAFMIEILVAALGGGNFGFMDESTRTPGGPVSSCGQFMLLIDPQRLGGTNFTDRVEGFVEHLFGVGVDRMPGDHRYARRAVAEREGIEISDEARNLLNILT